MTGGLLLDGLDESYDPKRVAAITAAGAPRVVVATGHGMLGVTLAALTGRLVADLVGGSADHPALEALSPERFQLAAP